MAQTWDEHRENHEAFKDWLAGGKGDLVPYLEMRRWRHRFFYALLIAAAEAVVILALLAMRKG